ncbi:MAG: hypothetical protein L3J12_07850, partial [Spirochaetales bacterium]|nr:hypothetical protein [Spirochaetales bacterium]
VYIENSFKIRTGIDGLVSFFTDFVIFFDFDLLTGRQFEAELRGNFKRTDLLLLYRFREERFGKSEKHLLRAAIEQEVGSGSVFLKLEIGDEGLSDNLSIGYRAVFN